MDELCAERGKPLERGGEHRLHRGRLVHAGCYACEMVWVERYVSTAKAAAVPVMRPPRGPRGAQVPLFAAESP